ncbi:MAG: acetyl-CoA carboxylase, carboxyltransferase subunit beta [Alphaproteobacteria bacterium]
MNWLSNYVRPKIQGIVKQKDIPDHLWTKCPGCGAMLFAKELEQNNMICHHCEYHMRLGSKKRLELLFDNGEYNRAEVPEVISDPLKFKDIKKYADRIKDARKKTSEKDAIIVAYGTMGKIPVVAAVFDFNFMGGSMGAAVGEGIVTAAELAVTQEAPLIIFPSSGGARMQEGIVSLMQMARTTIAVDKVKEKGLPFINVLTDPTTGGVTASFAMLGDIHIAEPGSIIGFAGARVIEQTIRETLPNGFQRAEYLLEHGMVDMVVHRNNLRETIIKVIGILKNTKEEPSFLPASSSRKK